MAEKSKFSTSGNLIESIFLYLGEFVNELRHN